MSFQTGHIRHGVIMLPLGDLVEPRLTPDVPWIPQIKSALQLEETGLQVWLEPGFPGFYPFFNLSITGFKLMSNVVYCDTSHKSLSDSSLAGWIEY